MQKKLIALAIAGLASSAAFAQSNVTVYGVVDGSVESVKAEGSTAGTPATQRPSMGRVASNSSLIGFKGVEDLGGGLKAVFQMESAFDLQSGAAAQGLAGRDTYVGLTGPFGTVVTGNLTDPARLFGAKVDMNPGASSIGFTGAMFGKVQTIAAGNVQTGIDNRKSNAVAYVSPTVGGFHAVAAYVAGENKTDVAPAVNSRAWELAAVFEWQKLFVGYAHIDAKDPATAAPVVGFTSGSKAKSDRAIATYAFPTGTKVAVLWDQIKLNAVAPVAGDLKRKAWALNVGQNFGANNVWLEYAKAKKTEGNFNAVNDNTGSKQITLGYSYDLSKRTMVHAYYSKITNEANAAYDFYVNAVGTAAGAIGNGADPQGYGVGLRHSF